MFAALEASLTTCLTGAITGATVFGTFDLVDFTAANSPDVAIRIDWGGYQPREQKDDAIRGDHQFDVSVIVNAARVSNTSRAAAVAGIKTILQRLIAWRPVHDMQASITSGAPAFASGGLWGYTITLTIPDTIIRAT